MNKIIRLVSIQLMAVISDMLSIGKNRKKKTGIYAGLLFFILLLSGVSFLYSMMIGSGLKQYHCTEILPAMFMAVTCLVTLITTVAKVKGTIFGFRDYDLVMSLPVSTGAVAVSRLIILYALNFLFELIIMVPMLAAYGLLVKPDILFYIIGFVTLFFVPMVPIVIASLLGTLIAYIASRFRHSNLISILFNIAFLVLIIGASFGLKGNGQELANMSKALMAKVNRIYPLAGMYQKALTNYDIRSFLLLFVISFAAFVIYTLVVKKVFKRMNTLILTGSYHVSYKMSSLKTSSPFRALYFKELKRFFSSTLYVINTGFGIVMLTVGAIAVLFVDLNKVLGNEEAAGTVINNLPVYICFCIVMTCTTMASISLEGKSLWIIKSLPIAPKTVYFSKIAVNLTIISPAVIDIIIIGIALKLGLVRTLLMLLLTVTCSVFVAFFGLIINLLLPNFSWTSETVVIKNSAATMITVFSSMGYTAVLFALLYVVPSARIAYLGFCLMTAVLDVVLYIILMTYGKKRYNFLQ